MSSTTVPPEILLIIAHSIRGKTTQKSFALVSHWCNIVVQPLLYRSIDLNIIKVRQAASHFANYPHLIPLVKRVCLYAFKVIFEAQSHWIHESFVAKTIQFLRHFTTLTHIWIDLDDTCSDCDISSLWTDDWLKSARSIRCTLSSSQLLDQITRTPPNLQELSIRWISPAPKQRLVWKLSTLEISRASAVKFIDIEDGGLLQFFDDGQAFISQDFMDWLVKSAPKLEVLQIGIWSNPIGEGKKLLQLGSSFSYLRFFGIYNLVLEKRIPVFLKNLDSYFTALESMKFLEGVTVEFMIGEIPLLAKETPVEPLLNMFMQVLDEKRLNGSLPCLHFASTRFPSNSETQDLLPHYELYKPGLERCANGAELDMSTCVYQPNSIGWGRNWVGFGGKDERMIRVIDGSIHNLEIL